MIEDALKRTRQSYFLILAISGITILFVFSVNKPSNLVEKKEAVEKLIKLDLNKYDDFAKAKVEEFKSSKKPYEFIGLDSLDLTIFGINNLKERLNDFDVSRRIYIKNSKFDELGSCKITDLNDINELELRKNIFVFIPDFKTLESSLSSFLKNNNKYGISINNILIDNYAPDNDVSTYYLIEDAEVDVYFELNDASTGASPTFAKNIAGKYVEIPNTSFVDWLDSQSYDDELINLNSDTVTWFTKGYNFDISESGMSLIDLFQNLTLKLDKYTPETQKINFLGLSIQGAFFFIASPILIVILLYFLLSNLLHLNSFEKDKNITVQEFSWRALKKDKTSDVEIISMLFIFPLISLLSITFTLFQAKSVNLFIIGIILISLIICLYIGNKIFKEFKKIKRKLNSKIIYKE